MSRANDCDSQTPMHEHLRKSPTHQVIATAKVLHHGRRSCIVRRCCAVLIFFVAAHSATTVHHHIGFHSASDEPRVRRDCYVPSIYWLWQTHALESSAAKNRHSMWPEQSKRCNGGQTKKRSKIFAFDVDILLS